MKFSTKVWRMLPPTQYYPTKMDSLGLTRKHNTKTKIIKTSCLSLSLYLLLNFFILLFCSEEICLSGFKNQVFGLAMEMRGSGRYGDSTHPRADMSGQRIDHKAVNYHGRPDPMASDKEHHYGALKDGQWRWERDASKAPTPMSPHMFNEGQRGDDSRSYYQGQGQRTDVRIGIEKQHTNDPLSLPRGDDRDIYEDNPLSQNFEGLEKKFLNDITKLSKEQNDAEDAENARHREKINTINVKYQKQLGALRARYASRRNEFLQKESQDREKQYQQVMVDSYQGSGMGRNDPQGYVGEPRGNYNANQYDTYREQTRFIGNNARDHSFEQRAPYPGGRAYDTGSRYY